MAAPTPVDLHVGNRIRLIRILRGFSQGKLAEALGITFQQIQKYERGANRVGAGRLYEIAHILDVSVGFFFEDLRSSSENLTLQGVNESLRPLRPPPDKAVLQDDAALKNAKLLTQPETLELVRLYYKINDHMTRKQIMALLRTLADKKP